MAGEWREFAVEELKAQTENALATGPFGSSIGSRLFTDSGIPVIRGSNLSEDIGTRLSDDGLVFLSPEKAREFNRSTVRDGDLVFTCWGTVNQVGLIDGRAAYREYIISNKQMKLTPDPAKADSLFLYYLFSSPRLQDRITNQSIGSSVPGFNLGQLRRMRIRIPEVEEQRAIAHILGTLDDKIELNRRMSETLEAMARALFQSWFLAASPPRSRAADLGKEGILEIGDGYRAKNSELGEPGLPFIRAANLDGGFDTDTAACLHRDSLSKAGRKIARRGDVAFTSKGTIGRFARVVTDREFVYSPQVCYWRSLDHARLHPVILYCWMRTDDLTTQIAAVAGQTDMAPYVSLQDQRAMTVPVFPPSQHLVASKIDSLLARQTANALESRILTQLRDVLLPKLISGEIRVKDAERIAAGVT